MGYSTSQKAYRVYNKRTRFVQDAFYVNWHVSNTSNMGSAPKWFYDSKIIVNSFNPPLMPKVQNHPSTFLVSEWSLYFLEFATVHPCTFPAAYFADMH